jgi:hypothetical protein
VFCKVIQNPENMALLRKKLRGEPLTPEEDTALEQIGERYRMKRENNIKPRRGIGVHSAQDFFNGR